MTEEKKQKKNITTGKVFLRTLGLVTGRWLFSIFGLAAFAIVAAAGVFFTVFVWELSLDTIIGVSALFAIVGCVVYLVISKIGKTAFRNAQITEISYAFAHDEFLNKDINPLELLDNRFEVSTVFPMVIRSIDLLLIMILKRKDKKFVSNMKREWRKSFGDFVACFLAGIVPIFGFCSLSWFLQNPEDGVLKGACDGLYGIFINRKKLVKRMLFIFFIELIVLIVIFLIIFLILVLIFSENDFAIGILTGIGDRIYESESSASILGCGMIAFLIVKFIPWLYVQSYGMISVLQIYTKATEENPPGTSPLYKKIIDKYNALKQKSKEDKKNITP